MPKSWRFWSAVWATCVVLGFVALARYETMPGAQAAVEPDWPSATSLARRGATLVLFAHPECPCTRATFAELGRLLTRAGTAPAVRILFVGAGAALRPLAARIPGAVIADDPEGLEAKRFRATTSGHVFLYDAQGVLLFHGGITPSRAHHGDSVGQSAILAHLAGRTAPADAPVFGCALFRGDR